MTHSADSPPNNKAPKANRGMLAMVLGIIGGMVLVCICLGGAVGALYLRESPDASARLAVLDIRAGECFGELPEGGWLQYIPVISCDKPHRYEAFALPPLYSESGDFPGAETLAAYNERECERRFESYVGVVLARTPFTITTVQPDAGQWERGQRTGLCILGASDGTSLTQSQEDTQDFFTEIPIMDALVGECLQSTADAERVNTVSCSEPHEFEVYEVAALEGERYPGDAAVTAFANVRCTSAFVDYIGAPLSETNLLSQSFQPTETKWTEGTRQVVCVLTDATGASLEGSMADSGTMTADTEPQIEDAEIVELPTLIRDLAVGDCFNESDYFYALGGEMLKGNCTQPHYYELFHTNTLPDAPLLDEVGLATAEAECIAALQSYVGISYDASTLDYQIITPTSEEWAAGERLYLCMLFDGDYNPLTESVQNSGEMTAWSTVYPGSEQTPLASLAVGDCYLDPKNDIYIFVITVPCDTYHHNEVFGIVESPVAPNTPYPADADFSNTVPLCRASFEPYVGLPYENSTLQIYMLTPTADQWAQGERTYICALYDGEYYFMERSVANSGSATAYPTEGELGERTPFADLAVGDCINFPINYSKNRLMLVVPCTEEHEQEVFGRGTYPAAADAPYPDYNDIDQQVATVCESAFDTYVGLPYTDSTLDYTYLGISTDDWALGGRDFVCTIVDGSYMPITQSQRDTGNATAYPPDNVPNAERVALLDLEVGNCYQLPVDYYKSREVLRVACTDDHTHELYAWLTYPDATADTPFPDFDTFATFVDTGCIAAFESYVGVAPTDSMLGYTYEQPTLAGWDVGERAIPCILFTYYDTMNTSAQGSRQ